MAPQVYEFERKYSRGVRRESGIGYSAVVVVTEGPEVVDWLDLVLFEWERDVWFGEENTGGLNSASIIASVQLTVLSRVLTGLRLMAVVEGCECGA